VSQVGRAAGCWVGCCVRHVLHCKRDPWVVAVVGAAEGVSGRGGAGAMRREGAQDGSPIRAASAAGLPQLPGHALMRATHTNDVFLAWTTHEGNTHK